MTYNRDTRPGGPEQYLVSDPRQTALERATKLADAMQAHVIATQVARWGEPCDIGELANVSAHPVAASDAPTPGEFDAFMGKSSAKESSVSQIVGELSMPEVMATIPPVGGVHAYIKRRLAEMNMAMALDAAARTPQPTEADLLARELAQPPRGLTVEQWGAYLCSFEGVGPMPYRYTAKDYATVRARVESGELVVPERILRHAAAPPAKKNWWER